MQAFAGCQFKSTFYATYLARTQFERYADWKSETRDGTKKHKTMTTKKASGSHCYESTEPSFVKEGDFDVYTNSVGIPDWCVILDFAGLYPSMMVSEHMFINQGSPRNGAPA